MAYLKVIGLTKSGKKEMKKKKKNLKRKNEN